ncbi:OstA-like protein [Chitinophaga filiformis]|uniref:LPS export ABC transporter periplasmic protein LptC n=1 Tax=Chitinophaga filiformis TaxID=104663 RepID=A0ABY4HXN0_CHIFI|nr:OstA-like protein [Chitinophaga filiformis]UPK68569.1 LPS export ABC transporter periplasmic protein LptC [Chitinophaga filiformis]
MILKTQQLVKCGLILAGLFLGRLFPATAQEVQPAGKDSNNVIHIIQSDKLNVLTKDSVQLNRFIGNAIFRQGNTLFYCDSALINRASNILDAYGHIHINQADSIHIYGEYLHYEGNTRMATLRDNARLTDGKVTLTGPELQYDMNARIGTYVKGGKLVNGSSVLTSQEGYYYADTKDVYFNYNVLLVDPEYTLSTDTLLYNTQTKIATIVAPTTINDGKTVMYATSGEYNTETGQGNFDSRPTIEDSTATITADRITMDKRTGLAYATGNMVYRDTAQHMTLLSNYGTVNQTEKTILATQHPLMILEREKDTLYLAADTLFSGVLKKDSFSVAPVRTSADNEETTDSTSIVPDSLRKPLHDSTAAPLADTSAFAKKLKNALAPGDSSKLIPAMVVPKDSALITLKPNAIGVLRDTAKAMAILRDSTRALKADSIVLSKDSAVIGLKSKALALTKDSLRPQAPALALETDTSATKDTSEIRYIRAWHHVRIYSDSLQGVADSIYYSSKDSIFRFYRNPVLWANETQLSGDTIFLYTKNQKADKLLLDQNALLVKESDPQLYNQIKGNQITGYFAGQALDWMHVDGNAESIYYVRDDDSAYVSVNRTLSGIINIYFREGQLHHISFIKDPEGTMYPFTQRPLDQMQLENFHWDIRRKPKSKYELMGTVGEAKIKEEPPVQKTEDEF